MAGEFVLTVGEAKQLEGLFNGRFLKGLPQPRIAMVGRSNVGKSSLINSLLGTRLARVSNQPGKTQHIHFYHWLDGKRIIADLPGYGFAKTSHSDRNRWERFIVAYLQGDPGLERVLFLLDARHGPTALDEEAARFLGPLGVRITPVFMKSDAIRTQSDRATRRKEAAHALKKLGYTFEDAFWVSSRTEDGLKQLARSLTSDPESL